MLFNSFIFPIFLIAVFAAYWLLPYRIRPYLLLLASYVFYSVWNVKYLIFIIGTTLISFYTANYLEHEKDRKKCRRIMMLSISICAGILVVFKYLNFLIENIQTLIHIFGGTIEFRSLQFILPVGISFYTFQTISYVVDVYHGKIHAERSLLYYSLYVSFFPQLVAGPIERVDHLLPQLKKEQTFNYDEAVWGLKKMAWGYFKKLVIADSFAVYVNQVYNMPHSAKGFSIILATVLFSIQIYCDFSGYSDIAIGTARLFGIQLMENFKSPYFAASIKEFWNRWHISLSEWFRDYVYIPLGGNRSGAIRHRLNLIMTFLLSGLWHGANWTYIIWGTGHGLGLALESLNKKKKNQRRIIVMIRTVLVFCFTVFMWIFFRANSVADAFYLIQNMFCGITHPLTYIISGYAVLGLDKGKFIMFLFSIILLAIFDYFNQKEDVLKRLSHNIPCILRWSLYCAFILFLILYSEKGAATEFVYFQF